MMLTELLDELKIRGVVLKVNGDRLMADMQRGSLTPKLQASLREHKAALLALFIPQAPQQLDLFTPQFNTEKALHDLYDRWCEAANPDNPAWRQQYADAAITAGLPCYDGRGAIDSGPDGWRQWATQTS